MPSRKQGALEALILTIYNTSPEFIASLLAVLWWIGLNLSLSMIVSMVMIKVLCVVLCLGTFYVVRPGRDDDYSK